MTSWARAGSLAALLGASVACRGEAAPADPAWGKEPCAHCAMIVDDRKTAAQILEEDGTRRYFDDLGCMIAFEAERGIQAREWVRDESRDAWLPAGSARYRSGARTPMDYGFVAGPEGTLPFDAVKREVLARKGERK